MVMDPCTGRATPNRVFALIFLGSSVRGVQVVFCRLCLRRAAAVVPACGWLRRCGTQESVFMFNIVSLRRSCRALGRRPVRLILRAAFGLRSEAAAEKGRMFAVFLTASITRRCRRVQTKHRCFTSQRRKDAATCSEIYSTVVFERSIASCSDEGEAAPAASQTGSVRMGQRVF